MAREHPIELFMPPNTLKAKVGGSGGVDMAAMKRGETAMEGLKSEFGGMAADDVAALAAARQAYVADPAPAHRAALLRAAHDLKGQAATLGFPLMARLAASLARLVGEAPAKADLPVTLVDAHVAAITAILRRNIAGADDKMTLILLSELDRQVGQALGPA